MRLREEIAEDFLTEIRAICECYGIAPRAVLRRCGITNNIFDRVVQGNGMTSGSVTKFYQGIRENFADWITLAECRTELEAAAKHWSLHELDPSAKARLRKAIAALNAWPRQNGSEEECKKLHGSA